MNVNELADKLDSISYECTLEEWRASPVGMAAAMLRQQQAEIEALKGELVRYADALGEERGNKALKNHEIATILTQVLDDCGLLKKENQ